MSNLFGLLACRKPLRRLKIREISQHVNSTRKEKAAKPTCKKFVIATKTELLRLIDRNDLSCPFYGKIGQDAVVEQLSAILVKAHSNDEHILPGGNALLFTGAASVGKTDFAKCLAKGLDLPFVETDAKQILGTDVVFELLKNTFKEAGFALRPVGLRNGRNHYVLPAAVFFIDELHGLRPTVMDALLKALEPSDSTLVTSDAYVDCSKILWIGATTERGEILARKPAFDTRFDKIEFENYTPDQIVQILQLRFKNWTELECRTLAARSGCIIREALLIGRKVERQFELMQLRGDTNRLAAIDSVGLQLGIDVDGISNLQKAVLKALALRHPHGMTYGQLAHVAKRGVEEIKQAVLPGLMYASADHPPLVVWNGQTTITEAGLKQVGKYN